MIIILAALQLTSNDVHSRLTRSKGAKILRAGHGPSDATDSTQLETMQFAENQRVLSRPKSTLLYVDSTKSYGDLASDVGVQSGQSHALV